MKHRLVLLSVLSAGVCLAQSSAARHGDISPEMKNTAAQWASVRRQELSIEVQRKSIAKQVAVTRKGTTSGAFIEPLPKEEALAMNCLPLEPRESENLISEAAVRQSISPDLLRAVIRQESGFRPCALSEKGAQGLMQLMPGTAAEFNINNPFDPHQNILGGAAYLRQLIERYSGNASLALSAYNAGPQRVDQVQGIPEIAETQSYVAAIFRDLGWAMPQQATIVTDVSLEEPDTEADVKLDKDAKRSAAAVSVDPQPPPPSPSLEKPASPQPNPSR